MGSLESKISVHQRVPLPQTTRTVFSTYLLFELIARVFLLSHNHSRPRVDTNWEKQAKGFKIPYCTDLLLALRRLGPMPNPWNTGDRTRAT